MSGPSPRAASRYALVRRFWFLILACVALGPLSMRPAAAASHETPPGTCNAGQRWFAELKVCAAPADPGCFAAPLPGIERALTGARPRTPTAGLVRFKLVNRHTQALYFAISPASGAVDFELRAPGGDTRLVVPEAQFCPTLCPRAGPVENLDCGAPAPAIHALAPGASVTISWSGELMVGAARACGEGQPRACSERQAAPAGRYSVRFCAFAQSSSAGVEPNASGLITRSRPRGAPSCKDVAFATPVAEPIAVHFP